MKHRRLYGAVLALGASVAVLAGGLFLLTHQRGTTTESVGPSGRALRDPFWAATLLLRELDVPTQARYGLGQLPEPEDNAVVIVLADHLEHRAALADRLVDWVAEGGHVVVAPSTDTADGWDLFGGEAPPMDELPDYDALLDVFGVTVHDDGDRHWLESTVVELERSNQSRNGTVTTLVTRSRRSITSAYCDAVVGEGIPAPPDLEARARVQVRASCGYGAGRLTAVSSTDLFDNTHLRDERGDNAAFFWDTVAPDGRPSQAILVLRGDAPSFFALLWARGWPLLLSLGAALVAWAAWQGQRFGPVRDRPSLARRSMLEHLDASGSLLWRHHRQRGLVAALRRTVRRRLARRSPAIAHLQGQALAEAVAALTEQPVDTIRRVLVEPPPTDRAAFVEMVRTLQTLWREASPVPLGSPS